MAERIVRCRAKLVDSCSDGYTEEAVLRTSESGERMEEDGTWDGRTLICNACYVALMPFTRSGAALTDEIPEAIRVYRTNRDFLANHDDPAKLLAETEAAVAQARPGSPRHASGLALIAMAKAEVSRRANV